MQTAVKSGRKSFDLEGKQMPLNIRFGVFVTMNPKYVGRQELPDNLKALFRPVCMFEPHVEIIAKVILFAHTFEDATTLAKKVHYIFRVFPIMLSQQKHYDFSMRAVKGVLALAGIV